MVQERRPFSNTASSRNRSAQYWRWLLPPMLLASLGLHGLVLFVPMGASDEDLVPPPDPEEDGITLTKIEAPQPRPRTDSAANAGTVKTTRPTPAAAPARPPQPAPSPQPTQTRQTPRSTTARAQTSPNGQAGRSPSASTGRSPRATAPTATTPSVPDLSAVDSVQNPNPTIPGVASNASQPAVDLAASNVDSFEAYIKIFESYNGVKISEEEANEFRELWLDSFRDRGDDFSDLDIQPLDDIDPIPYTANICLPAPPETAQVLVLVDADGELDEYQQFVQRTGYRDFDTEVTKRIGSHTFPESDQPQAYLAEIGVDYDPDDCEWPPKVDKLPDDYFAVLDNYVGPKLTTTQEAETAQIEWLTAISEEHHVNLPQTEDSTLEPLEAFNAEVEYPLAICLPIEPVDAQWGVVVNPDGSLAAEPTPLRSTGYQNFDDRAQALVQTFKFPESDTLTPYVVEVPVAYNSVNCQPLDSEEFEIPATTAAAGDDATTPASPATSRTTSDVPAREETGDRSTEILAFDAERQAQLLAQGRENIEADSAGALNRLPGVLADAITAGWPDGLDLSCFLNDVSAEAGLVPVEAAEDAIVISVNADDAPLRLSSFYGAEASSAGDYCGAPLVQLSLSRVPQLFASAVGFGDGGSNTLVVLWSRNPRDE